MTQALQANMIHSANPSARRMRAPFLSDETLSYWSIMRRTVSALKHDASMKTTCRSAAQLLPPSGNPARDLMARFL